ncbi:MAG: pimeloyl-ACP methyl ester carboxylesterase [Kiritimatiellia bacterium]|jgi:pimeloyl-ACP methyl ester carboxylesterase
MAWLDRMAVANLQARGVKRRKVRTKLGYVHVLDAPGLGTHGTVVLLHGLSSQAADYSPLLQRLRRKYRRVIAPDMPGHGASLLPDRPVHAREMAMALAEALGQVVDEPAMIVGNSLGGMASIRLATDAAELVKGLVLVCPGGAPMDSVALRDFLRVFDVADRVASDAFIDRFAARPPRHKAIMSWGVRVRFSSPDVRRVLSMVTPQTLLSASEVASLTVPTLCLWGPEDQVLPASHRAFFRENLPDHAVFEEPDGYGHAPFMDRPDHLADRIHEWGHQLWGQGDRG